MSEGLAGMDIGHMDLDAGLMHRGDGIPKGIAVVGVCPGIEDDAVVILERLMNPVNQNALMIALEDVAGNPELCGTFLNLAVDVFQRDTTIGIRFPNPGQVDIGSMQDQNLFHRANTPLLVLTVGSCQHLFHRGCILCLGAGGFADDGRGTPLADNHLRHRLELRAEHGIRKGQVALLPALEGILDFGEVGMKSAHSVDAKAALHRFKHLPHSLRVVERTEGTGIQMPEIDAGDQPVVHPAQLQHLLQRTQLVDFAHRLRAEVDVTQPLLIQSGISSAQSILGKLQCLLAADLCTGAGMNHHPLGAHRAGGLRALEDVPDAGGALFFFQTGQRDIVGRMQ